MGYLKWVGMGVGLATAVMSVTAILAVDVILPAYPPAETGQQAAETGQPTAAQIRRCEAAMGEALDVLEWAIMRGVISIDVIDSTHPLHVAVMRCGGGVLNSPYIPHLSPRLQDRIEEIKDLQDQMWESMKRAQRDPEELKEEHRQQNIRESKERITADIEIVDSILDRCRGIDSEEAYSDFMTFYAVTGEFNARDRIASLHAIKSNDYYGDSQVESLADDLEDKQESLDLCVIRLVTG